ncbi:chondroitin AC/alginate lyase [Mycena amicta]|nr:chondroitin AC/alginate lyase [Mycena amicta]
MVFPTLYTPIFHLLFILLATVPPHARATNPFVQYAVDFPDPDVIVGSAGNLSSRYNGAEATVVAWAEEMASHGPWSVTFKPVLAPSNDIHDYMSWAPYQWPNCTGVGNKTILTDEQVWKICPYINKDGQVNPDRTLPNDFQSFFNLSDAVLYNAIAATFQTGKGSKSSVYSRNVVKFIDTWFLNDTTHMNPNLNYAQMDRGPGGQQGSYTGILDLRGFAKIASGILILRKSANVDWTSDIDAKMVAWCNTYIDWLQTSPSGKQASTAKNNHGTIFVSQFAALKLIVSDVAGAVSSTQGYFNGLYQGQLQSNGDQPLEASRTHPWHYRNFNIAGMVTNARLLNYADPSSKPWSTTAQGATIQTALNFLMTTDPSATGEANTAAEIYPNVAAVAAAYGDPAGKYVGYFNRTGFEAYVDEPTFLWAHTLALAGGDSSVPAQPVSNPAAVSAAGKLRVGSNFVVSLVTLSLVGWI